MLENIFGEEETLGINWKGEYNQQFHVSRGGWTHF